MLTHPGVIVPILRHPEPHGRINSAPSVSAGPNLSKPLSPMNRHQLLATSVRARSMLLAAFALLAAETAHAANGTWARSDTPLAWDDAANWSGSVIADGAGFTADFGAVDINAYTVVNLASSRTIGNIIFGDSDLTTPGSWNIGNNGVVANVLTLSGTSPTITVPNLGSGQNVSISANLTGTGGLTKAGAGTLISFGTKTYTGDTIINSGSFVTTNVIPGGNDTARTALTIATGATLEFRAIYGDIPVRPSNITGGGKILKTGTGMLTYAGVQGGATGSNVLSLSSGGVIDIREGSVRLGNYNSQANSMAGNLAALIMATGTTLNIDSTNAVVGSLAGAGTITGGYYYPRTITIGADNTDTTFAGTFATNAALYNADSSPNIIKTGQGTLTLTGAANIRSVSGNDVLRVTGGTALKPSTLNLNFTAPSAIGYIISGANGGNANLAPVSTDNVVVDHSAGTLAVSQLNIGNVGTATYTARGNANIDAFTFTLGFTGPTTGTGAATLNVADNAQIRIFSNRSIVMGQYYGRPVTVNQTGGFVGLYSGIATTLGGTGSLAFKSANTAATYNLAGGTLSIPAITRDALGSGAGGGNGILNFNGGTLQITSADFSVPDGIENELPLVTCNVKESGATIDPYGLAVTFNVPLRHSGSAAFDGGLKVAGTNGGGSLTLSAANTYNGDTVVNSGDLTLANTGQLAFTLGANGVGTRLRGTGNVTLDGTFVIDRTGANLTNGNTWQLVANSTLNETYGPMFTVAGFTENNNVWTLVDGSKTWTFSEATGVLSLQSATAATPYASWAAAKGLDGIAGRDPATSANPDHDAFSNLLEFAFDGNPLASDGSLTQARSLSIGGTTCLTLTIATRTGAQFSGTSAQVSGTIDGVTYTVEASSDLSAWTVPVVEATGAEVAALQAGLPALDNGWTYRTFRPAAALATTPRIFLRARAE